MKELSIEEKAKAYDEALERAKECHIDGLSLHQPVKDVIEHIFPELKESEDERIRKSLIDMLKNDEKCYLKEIAWLEKQGEQKPKGYTFKAIPRLLEMIEPTNRAKSYCKKLIDSLQKEGYTTDAKIVSDCLKQMNDEKIPMATMDEQKPFDYENATIIQRDFAPKGKPKFKNGQWIVWQDKCYKIIYNGCGYELSDQNGLITSLEYGTVDENAHIWDITKDAKDGDVLTTYTGRPFIFKGCLDERHPNSPVAYCGVNYDNCFFVSSGISWWTDENVYPVTKEQRDLLFQKMKESGYEWDAEKKELKKIEKQGEQKPMKVYRVENEAEQKGLWRKFDGTWQPLFDMLTDGKCKDMPMEDSPIYREGGKRWFASAPSKETLQKWFSKRDLEELVSKGFTISEFEVVGYKKVSNFEYIFTRDNIINRNYLEVSDIYSEQKPTDKVEPKFKVGDWIINNDVYGDVPVKIKEIGNYLYLCERQDGVIIELNKNAVLNEFKHWDIADAKDGDVLSDGTTIFIFKDLLSDDSVISHCDYDTDSGKGYVFCPLSMNLTCSKITPATKEQYNLLFQKIKENGYEWDAEKKELKKIEQKPTQETKPFKVEHGKYYYCIKDCFCGGRKQASKGDVVQALRGLPIMSLKDASEYFLPVNFIKEIW